MVTVEKFIGKRRDGLRSTEDPAESTLLSSVVWNAVKASEGLVLLKLVLPFMWVCSSCELNFLLVILSLKHTELYLFFG